METRKIDLKDASAFMIVSRNFENVECVVREGLTPAEETLVIERLKEAAIFQQEVKAVPTTL